jgi:predicted DNA-binding transcriptional regulator AlpA
MTTKPKKFLTVNQLTERWGDCSRMLIERRLREDPRFPRPMRLGGRLRLFAEDEVEAYEKSFIAGRQASMAGGGVK